MDWTIKQIKMLEKTGFKRRNPSSQVSSPYLIVPKPGRPEESRMTMNSRYANSQVQPVTILPTPGKSRLVCGSFLYLKNSRNIFFLHGTWKPGCFREVHD
jgi:hypothetical protein